MGITDTCLALASYLFVLKILLMENDNAALIVCQYKVRNCKLEAHTWKIIHFLHHTGGKCMVVPQKPVHLEATTQTK